jgi:imidazolonepropionase-like amidohydrolase
MFRITTALLAIFAAGFIPSSNGAVTAFVGARIIDGTGKPAIEKATLVVRDGKIEAVGASVKPPAGAQIINAAGKTIIPGLINVHGHLGETQGVRSGPDVYTRDNILSQLGLYARYGITTVFSLGGDKEAAFKIRDEQDTPSLDRARVYLAGTIIPPGLSPEDARKMVDTVVAMKADIVKIRVDDNLGTTAKMAPPEYKAVIDEAHKNGLRLAVHLYYLDDAKDVLKSGADMIAHSIRDRDVDAEVISLLKARNVPVCPTLMREVSTFVYESTPKFFSDPFFLREVDMKVVDQLNEPKRQEAMKNSKSAQQYKVALEVASRNLKKLSDAGVTILMGTDSGPFARFQGYFEQMELEMMNKAGLTPMQVLMSATGDAAKFMKLSGKVGSLQKGAWADLLVLNANPLDDIVNTRKIDSVWIAGNRVQRQ